MKNIFIVVLSLLFTSCGFYTAVMVQNRTNESVVFKYYFKDSTLSFDIPSKEALFHGPPFLPEFQRGKWTDSIIDVYLSNIEKIEIQKDHDTIRYNGKDIIKKNMKKNMKKNISNTTIFFKIK